MSVCIGVESRGERRTRFGFGFGGGAEAEARLDVGGEHAFVVGPVDEQREQSWRAVQRDQDAPQVAPRRLRRQRADRRRQDEHLRPPRTRVLFRCTYKYVQVYNKPSLCSSLYV